MTRRAGEVHEALGISWSVESRALEMEEESGDLHVVALFPGGALLAVIDGLGHGTDAAIAARAAAACLTLNAGRSVRDLTTLCHAELRRTRGAVMSLASLDYKQASMSWLGVGNVEGVLFREEPAAREGLITRGGIVGHQMAPLREATLAIARGDTIVLATDGIRSDFAVDRPHGRAPSELAGAIIARYRKRTDDALVLVARIEGAP